MSDISEEVKKVLDERSMLHKSLDNFALTGHRNYARLIDIELKEVKMHYTNKVYNDLMHIYNNIQQLYAGEE